MIRFIQSLPAKNKDLDLTNLSELVILQRICKKSQDHDNLEIYGQMIIIVSGTITSQAVNDALLVSNDQMLFRRFM